MRTRELAERASCATSSRAASTSAAYLQATGVSPQALEQRLRDEAAQSVARELVLEAVADKLGLEVTDDEIREQLREQGEPDEDIEEFIEAGGADRVRDDLRMKKAVDRDRRRGQADLAEEVAERAHRTRRARASGRRSRSAPASEHEVVDPTSS